MRIAVDARSITSPRREERAYFRQLTRALALVDEENEYLLYTRSTSTLTGPPELPAGRFSPILLRPSREWSWLPLTFPYDAWQRRAALAHVLRHAPPIASCPVVLTLFDTAFDHAPDLFLPPHRIALHLAARAALRPAAYVITGSTAGREDLVRRFGVRPERVRIVPCAPDPAFQPMDPSEARRSIQERRGIRGPYLLATGVGEAAGNAAHIVRVYNQVARSVPQRLLLLGREEHADDLLRESLREAVPGREPRFTGYVPDADLPALYAGADLFLHLPRWDGSGIPMLEAMAAGAAVLAASTGALPELGGEAAATVDPRDGPALAERLRSLLLDPYGRSRRAERGPAQAARFNWERTARETLEVYSAAATPHGLGE